MSAPHFLFRGRSISSLRMKCPVIVLSGSQGDPEPIGDRAGKEQGIKDVKHASKSWDGRRGVLPLAITLDHRFHQVAELRDRSHEKPESDGPGPVQGRDAGGRLSSRPQRSSEAPTAKTMPPIAPSTVLLGLRLGQSLWRPASRPSV